MIGKTGSTGDIVPALGGEQGAGGQTLQCWWPTLTCGEFAVGDDGDDNVPAIAVDEGYAVGVDPQGTLPDFAEHPT